MLFSLLLYIALIENGHLKGTLTSNHKLTVRHICHLNLVPMQGHHLAILTGFERLSHPTSVTVNEE